MNRNDITSTMLDNFNRKQETHRVLVQCDGMLRERDDDFEDEWTLDQKRSIVDHFVRTINYSGSVIVAFDYNRVVGFAVLEPYIFGATSRYCELSYLHVTREARGHGIGEALFHEVREVAKRKGAQKLYIGAHPSIETQSFYHRMNCILTKEVYLPIYEREKRDIQLECPIGDESKFK
ncbi:GNAT family N-acetyltransferase [Pontibacillus yanchengensis]|uniref:GNAT family N-acetyltransferase n=1 Tax=Pontibacillus yanchengensis TaxID=462910 RepID=UPI001378B9E7|nr:GNAT family N-acetyltransferase [Pontibacillus yanchengensis]